MKMFPQSNNADKKMKVVKKTWKWSASRLPTTEKRGFSIHLTSDHSRVWPQDQARTSRHLLWSLLCHPLLLLLMETNKRFLPNVTCVESVSVRFRSKQQGMRVKFELSFHFSLGKDLKSRSLSLFGLSLLRNHTGTLATHSTPNAIWALLFSSYPRVIQRQRMISTHYPGLNHQRHSHTTNNF